MYCRSSQTGKRPTVELTRRRESKHPPPHQASCERRSRRSRPNELFGATVRTKHWPGLFDFCFLNDVTIWTAVDETNDSTLLIFHKNEQHVIPFEEELSL